MPPLQVAESRVVHGQGRLRPGRRGPRAAAPARHREQLPDLGGRDRPARRDAHRHRAGSAGPRQLRQAAGRLLDRRLRQRDARPAVGARHRAGHRRRPLPRRRHRPAVRLPVPRALPAARAGRQRRPGPGALGRAAGGHPARRRTRGHRPRQRVRPAPLRPADRGEIGRTAGWRRVGDLAEAGDALLALKDVEARRAFLRTLRGVVDARGQAVTALDRLYLADSIPLLVIWGSRDPIVPASARRDGALCWCPSARIEVFQDAGHWPHLDEPERFCRRVAGLHRQHGARGPRPRQRATGCSPRSSPAGRSRSARSVRRRSVAAVERYDVAVIGGGAGGSAAALAAAGRAGEVVLVDRGDFPRDKACGDGIAPHALDVLADLGVTGARRRFRARPGAPAGVRRRRSWSAAARPAFTVPREDLRRRPGRGRTVRRRRCAAGPCAHCDHDGRPRDHRRLAGRRVVIGADGADSRGAAVPGHDRQPAGPWRWPSAATARAGGAARAAHRHRHAEPVAGVRVGVPDRRRPGQRRVRRGAPRRQPGTPGRRLPPPCCPTTRPGSPTCGRTCCRCRPGARRPAGDGSCWPATGVADQPVHR